MALRQNWVWERNEKPWKKKEEEMGRRKKTREQWRVGFALSSFTLLKDAFSNKQLSIY